MEAAEHAEILGIHVNKGFCRGKTDMIREILSRKCEDLFIDNVRIYIDDVAELIQVFKSLSIRIV